MKAEEEEKERGRRGKVVRRGVGGGVPISGLLTRMQLLSVNIFRLEHPPYPIQILYFPSIVYFITESWPP